MFSSLLRVGGTKMPKKREHVTSERGVQHGRLRMGATRNRVAGKSNQQRFEDCPSQMPNGCTKYSGVGGWDQKKRGESQCQECERRQERVGEKGRELCMYLLMGYRSVILSYDDAVLACLSPSP